MRSLRILSVVGVSAILLSAGVAFAEDTSTTNVTQTVTAAQTAARQAVEKSEALRAEVKEKSEAARQAVVEKMQAAREEAKKKMEISREEAKMRVEAVREKAKVRIEAQREKAAERLATIQDKVKQQSAEKIAAQFERLNKKWTDHFLKLLERYDEVLQKMRDRVGIAASAGREIIAADAAIQSASIAIENARAAIVTQAAKTYTLDATVLPTPTTANDQGELLKGLRAAFQELHRNLFSDLFALRDGVMKDARTEVQNALQTLGSIPKVDDSDDATTIQ